MAFNDALADWQKPGCKIALHEDIDDDPAAMEHILREIGFGALPQPNKELTEWDIKLSGSPMKDADNYVLGRSEPNFTIEGPMTTTSLAIMCCSLFQNANYQAASHYEIEIYDGPVAPVNSEADALLMKIEGGIAGQSVFKAIGCMARTLSLTIPPSGADGGKATFSGEIMAAVATRGTAFTAGGVTDTGTYQLSTDFSFKLNTVAAQVTQLDLAITNNAERSPNIGATPDFFSLGELQATGNISCILTSADSDDWDKLYDAYEAKTVVELMIYKTDYLILAFDVLLKEPTLSPQGNLVVCQFPFMGVFVDANTPQCDVYSGTDILDWATA